MSASCPASASSVGATGDCSCGRCGDSSAGAYGTAASDETRACPELGRCDTNRVSGDAARLRSSSGAGRSCKSRPPRKGGHDGGRRPNGLGCMVPAYDVTPLVAWIFKA